MEESAILTSLKALDGSKNKQTIYQNLSSLRRVLVDKSQFTCMLNYGGIRSIVGCLLQKNINIVDTALSILGNCCTERDCAKEVVKYHGLRILSDILKQWSQDSVICRTCRIIGNIAQFDNYASEFYKYGIIPIVVGILNKCTTIDDKDVKKDPSSKLSMGTQVMAVRLLRLLWESYSNRQNMLQDGVVRAVSLVLIRRTEKWSKKQDSEPVRKQTEKFLDSVLKCLLLFSKWGTLECAQQILADGTGFKTLVALIEINPYSSVKCLTNLSHVATSRSDIANADAVDRIVNMLREHLDRKPTKRCLNDLIGAFCLFCRHPMNCSEVKRAGGLQVILEILKNCRSRRQEYQIVNALSGFHFDEQSQEILMSNAIVKIVTDCLERNLKSKEDINEGHSFIKRKRKTKVKLNRDSIENKQYGKRFREHSPSDESSSSSKYMGDVLAFVSGRMTPPDSDSSPMSSPSCTPPIKTDYDADNDDDSVNYSPVCSDDDEDLEQIQNNPQTPDPGSEEESQEEYENEKTHFESSDFQERSIIIMLVMLSRVSHMKPTTPELGLGSRTTILILLKYLRESRYPGGRITTLLTRIVSNPENLIQLIIYDIVPLIHSLTDTQHNDECNICFRMSNTGLLLLKHISVLAESDNGKGQLLNLLHTVVGNDKIKCMLSIPLMIKSKQMLMKIMDSMSGLNFLTQLFIENSDLRYQVTVAFNNLACSVNINNPVSETLPKKISKLNDHYEFNPNGKNTITIILDDGSTVNTDRDFLIEQADYFKVMLTGSFKESNEETIKLKNVSNKALQYLLNLLHSNYKNLEPQQLNVELSTVLEVIVLTDIYLLESLTDWLTRCVEQFSLKVESACEIYNWSVVSGTNFLRIETVAFILTADMKPKERFNLFENIINCDLLDAISDDVQRLISRYLKIR